MTVVVGIGVDDVDVERLEATLRRTPGVEARLFTPEERAYASLAKGSTRVQRLAARFAAKEAVLKAMGVGLGACGFHDIEVVRDEGSGAPALLLRGAALALAEQRGVRRWHLSLTHTPARATAFVLAES